MSAQPEFLPAWHSLAVGHEFPVHTGGPINRTTLALYAGGSGDHVRLHIDSDYAKEAGFDDVFAHGMLSMAYLAQLLLLVTRQENIRSYAVRFTAITPVHARVSCLGKVVEKIERDGERLARLELRTQLDDGTVTLRGEAVVAVTH